MIASVLLLALLAGPVMVVAPTARDGDAATAWVGEVVADELPRALADAGVATIDRIDRLRAQQALELPPVTLTRASTVRIAEALGAARVVVGTYTIEGAVRPEAPLRLELGLLDVERGSLSTPLVTSGVLRDLPLLVRSTAWDISLAGRAPLTTRDEFMRRGRAIPFEAARTYGQALASRPVAERARLLRSALQADPALDPARLALAQILLEGREFSAAHHTLSLVVATSPVARRARFLQGVALQEMGRYEEAAATFAALATTTPTPAVLTNRALALARQGRPGAVELLRQAVEAAPLATDVAFNLGWALLKEGDPQAAVFWLRGVVVREPLGGPARVVLTWALRQAGRIEEADQEWRGVLAMAPGYEALATPDLGRRFERIFYSERLFSLDRESRSDAEVAARLVSRAERLLEAGDAPGALRELNRSVYLDPYRPRVHVLLARAHIARGERDKAENELRMALWSHEDPAVRVELATLLRDLGRVAEARKEAERVLSAQAGNVEARKLLDSLPR